MVNERLTNSRGDFVELAGDMFVFNFTHEIPSPGYSDLQGITPIELEILRYCQPHLDQMWAATISGLILDRDFRETKIAANSVIAEADRVGR